MEPDFYEGIKPNGYSGFGGLGDGKIIECWEEFGYKLGKGNIAH